MEISELRQAFLDVNVRSSVLGHLREGETDRQTDRQTETETDRQTDRERQRQRDRDKEGERRDRQTHRQRQTDIEEQTETERQRQGERGKRERDRDRERLTERQTERQTEGGCADSFDRAFKCVRVPLKDEHDRVESTKIQTRRFQAQRGCVVVAGTGLNYLLCHFLL